MNGTWDAIVIGSGIGGLTAAGLLAGVAGKRVLVLEKHTEPGGLTHVFRRDGASWDVGLHYVGEMEEGTLPRSLMDFLSGGRLRWNRMPENFERFIYPGVAFEVPSDPAAYRQRLVEEFPDEECAILQYFRDIRRVQRWIVQGFLRFFMPAALGFIPGLARRLGRAMATQTTAAYLEKRFTSPVLRALLASQWGDYGLPPSQSAFATHAMIVGHYFHGASFPEGGSGRIARTFERGIEARGGAVRVCQEVTSVIVEQGRAVGVRVIDRRGAVPTDVEYRAPVIISDAGARLTFERLLPTDGATGRKTARLRSFMDGLGDGASAVTLYLRLKAPVSTIGIKGENVWINTDIDHEARGRPWTLGGRPAHIYVSFPSAKSGEDTFHTAEIISFVDAADFAAWKDKPHGNRGADYSALKEKIADGLMEVAETAIPGLKDLVSYRELSTPLTVEHYTSHPRGQFYGLPATPRRYAADVLGPVTPVPGLFLAGSDAGSLGIVGALMGGVAAATQVLGPFGFFRIMAAVRGGKTNPVTAARSPDKKRAVLAAKRRITPTTWELRWKLDEAVSFAPGQFARLHIGEDEWRDYSIASAPIVRAPASSAPTAPSAESGEVTLLVSTRTGGKGSRFAESAALGTETEMEIPLGSYRLLRNDRRRVFVATGTGLAPFLPMLGELRRSGEDAGAELLFGCATRADNPLPCFAATLPRATRLCMSREAPPPGGFHGRVTAALGDLIFDPLKTDFYVCGSAAMVADCRERLEKAGALFIHTETY